MPRMESVYNQNSEHSLNFAEQVLPNGDIIHDGKEQDEEEAAEDEEVKENELQDLMHEEFGDFVNDNDNDDDDDDDDVEDEDDYDLLSCKIDEEKDPILDHDQNNWTSGKFWFSGENNLDKDLADGFQENHVGFSEFNVQTPSEIGTENGCMDYLYSGRGENPDPNASGDNSAPCSSVSWHRELGEHKDQISDRSYNSGVLLPNGEHSKYNGVSSSPEKGLNPNAAPFSASSHTKNLNRNSKTANDLQYCKRIDLITNYQAQRNEWSTGMNDIECHLDKVDDVITDKLQHQYIRAGMDDDYREYTQLKILYDARGREVNKLQHDQESATARIGTLNAELEYVKGDNEELMTNINKLQKSLEEFKDSNEKQNGTIDALDSRIKNLEDSKLELHKQLNIAEATIEGLNQQVAEHERTDAISRARVQHDIVINSMQKRHNDEMQSFREENDDLRNKYQQKCEEAVRLQHELNQSISANEQMLFDRAETINRLTKSLEESHQQCEHLLRTADKNAENRYQSCDSGLASQSSVSDKVVSSLQEEISSLKEELEMYESTNNLFGSIQTNDTMAQLNVKRTLNWKSPQSPANEPPSNELLCNLKGELERCLSSNRSKRSKLTKLQADYRNNLRDVDLLKSQLTGTEKQIAAQQSKIVSLQTQLSELQPLTKDSHVDRIHELEKVRIEKDNLLEELEEAQEKLAEANANETQLNEAVRQLQQQMSQLVHDNNEDRRQATQRCQQTYLQLHAESIKKIRKEMSQLHSEEMKKVQQELQQALKEVDSVKEMYVAVCQEKNEVEEKLEEMIKKSEETERRMEETAASWKVKLRELQYECDQRTEQTITEVEMQKAIQQNLDSLHAEKDRETIQKIMDVTHRLEMEKEIAVKDMEEKKNKEFLKEMKKMNEKLNKEHQETLKALKQKLIQDKDKYVELVETGWRQSKLMELNELREKYEGELQRVTEKLTQEKLIELKQLDEKRDKERKKLIQHIVLKKNKEKHEQLKQMEEERKEEFSRILAAKNEELKQLQSNKNEEFGNLQNRFVAMETEYDEKMKFIMALIKEENDASNEVKSKGHIKEVEEFAEWKEKNIREIRNELKILVDQKDLEKKRAILKLVAQYDGEQNALKEERADLINKLQLGERQLRQKSDELEELRADFEKQLQGELEEIQAKLTNQKEREKLEALEVLSSRKRKETQEAILTLTVKKELQHEEAMKQLEKKLEKEKDDAIRVMAKDKEVISCCEHRLDLDCLKSLQEQNNELLKLYKNAKDEFEKEKSEIQLQHTNAMTLLKEKHLHLVKSLQREQQAARERKDTREEDRQQISSLKNQVRKLDSELKLYQAKMRELETIVAIKNSQLETLQQEQNFGLKNVEVEVQSMLSDLKVKLREKENEIQRLKLDFEKVTRELKAKLAGRNSGNANADAQKKLRELKIETQKKEETLLAEIHRLDRALQETKMQMQLASIKANEEIDKLKTELDKANKERDTITSTLESGSKEQASAIVLAEKEKAQLKSKLHQCQKVAQSREVQLQKAICKLQQDHMTIVKDLNLKIEEMKKSSVVRAESRIHEMSQMHLAQVTALREQYTAELTTIQKQYSNELETVRGLVQHYQTMYKQLQVDCDSENAIEIQASIKQVVKALQRDLFQYLNGLNKRVAQRIHKEVMRERRTIVARLKEQFDVKDSKALELSVSASSQVETQYEAPSLSGSQESGKGLMNVGTSSTWTGLTQTHSGGFLSGNAEYTCTSSKMALERDAAFDTLTTDKLSRLLHNFTLRNNEVALREQKPSKDDKDSSAVPEKNKDVINPLRPAISFDHISDVTSHKDDAGQSITSGSTGKQSRRVPNVPREQPIGQSASEIVVSKSTKAALVSKGKRSPTRSNRIVSNDRDATRAAAKKEGHDLDELMNELKSSEKQNKTFNIKVLQRVIESSPEIKSAIANSFQNNSQPQHQQQQQQQTHVKRIYDLRNSFNETQLKVGDTTSKTFVPLETESDSSLNEAEKMKNNKFGSAGEVNWASSLDSNSAERQWVRKHIDTPAKK